MKLTNQQIEAICNVAQKDFDQKNKIKETQILSSEDKKEAKQTCDTVKSLSKWAFDSCIGSYNQQYKTVEHWENLILKRNTKKVPSFNRLEFKDKIHLASIDAEDLRQLYTKLKIKI